MNAYQKDKCADIIKKASNSALIGGAVSGFTALPIQTKMVIELADVFGIALSEISASTLVKKYFSSGSIIFSAISTASWLFPPAKIVAGTIDAFKAAEKTEDFGWKMVDVFDNKLY